MKNVKILTIILVVFVNVNSSFGQFARGDFLIGASSNLNFSSSTYKEKSGNTTQEISTSNSLNISPEFGVFVIDRFVVGGSLPISISVEKNEQSNITYNTSSIMFSPFLRYYFGSGNSKPYVMGSIGTGGQTITLEDNSGNSIDYKTGLFSTKLGLGLDIFLTNHLALDLGLNYNHLVKNPKGSSSGNSKEIYSGVNFEVGFLIHL